MAEKNPNEGYASKEYVAFLLLKEIQEDERVQAGKVHPTRKETLDLYADCLYAASGYRDKAS